jgi:putative redox protein
LRFDQVGRVDRVLQVDPAHLESAIYNQQSTISNPQSTIYNGPMRPPVVVTTTWKRELAFDVTAAGHAIVTDGDGRSGMSPVQLLCAGLAGCMATDVALILTRGRQDLRALVVTLTATRAEAEPRRLLAIAIHFAATGPVNAAQLDRAIALSKEKYCSVWHSLREDITLETTTSIDA